MPIEPPDFSAYYRTQATIGDLMRQQSQAQADAALRSGAIWSNAITDISRMAMALPQTIERTKAYAAERQATAADRMAQTEQRRAALAAQQKEAFEADQLKQMFSDPQNPPTPQKVFSLIGPERGAKLLTGVQALQPKPEGFKDVDERSKILAARFAGMDALPEPLRAEVYPQIRERSIQEGLIKPEDAPEQYDPKFWQVTRNYGAKPPEPKPPRVQLTDFAEGKRIVNLDTGEKGPVLGQPKPPASQHVPPMAGLLEDDAIEDLGTKFRLLGTGAIPTRIGEADRAAALNAAARQRRALGTSSVQETQQQAARKADSGALTKMTTMKSAAEAFEAKALAQSDLALSLSDKVDRTQVPIINKWLLAGKADVLGDKNTQNLFNAVTTFSTEYAKIMEGSTGSVAASTESARKAAERLINAGLNKGQFADVIEQMKWEMRQTLRGYDTVIDHINTRMGANPNPPAPMAPPGAAPSGAIPARVGERRMINGRLGEWDGKGWKAVQ